MTARPHIKKQLLLDIDRALRGWCYLWGVDDLAPQITVEFSSRMTRSLGSCYPDRKLIRIARWVLEESDALVQEVLCHEAAHVAAHHLYGSSIRPHGSEWKALMHTVGYPSAVRYKSETLTRLPATARKRDTIGSILRNLRNGIWTGLARS